MDQLTSSHLLQMLNAGDYSAALALAKEFTDRDPSDRDATYFHGLALLMGGEAAAAIPWLQRGGDAPHPDPVRLNNLATALLRSNRHDEAISQLTRALELKPDYAQARYNLGSAWIAAKQAEKAEPLFKSLAEQHPANADYLCAWADALREANKWKRARRIYENVLTLDPDFARAHTNLGRMLIHLGELELALTHCRRAVELTPQLALAHRNLGDCLAHREELDEAMEAYADAYERDPDDAELCTAIGRVWQETHALAEAQSWYQKALTADPGHVAAQCGMADILNEADDHDAAIALLTDLREKHPEEIQVYLSLADALWDNGDATAALEQLRLAQTLQPDRIAIYGKIGHILSSSGDVEGAIAAYQKALDQNANAIPALSGMATTVKGKLDPQHVATMERILERRPLRPGPRASLHNGLAFYYDGVKDAERAALHSREANRYQWESRTRRGWEYSPEEYAAHIDRLIATFDAEHFERMRRSGLGNDSDLPVFIVAMPRSGTTLTEQILARHPQVLGVGERPFANQAMTGWVHAFGGEVEGLAALREPDARKLNTLAANYLGRLQQEVTKSAKQGVTRVVDKMPDNYSLVGWILTLFPNAKIIHVKRDPRDVALSCWMTQFGSIRWACHVDHLTTRIHQYQRIMRHWRAVIPDRFMEFDYEDLVADQERVSRQLVEWIGLEWDPRCLEFYKSDRIVRTASITQVREPIYTQSVAKWKRFEPFLPELFAPLSPDD